MLHHNVIVAAHYRRLADVLVVGSAAGASWAVGLEPQLRTQTFWGAIVFSTTLTASFAVLGARFDVYQARRTEHLTRELRALLEVLVYALGISCLTAEMVTPGLPGRAYLGTLVLGGLSLLLVHGTMRL